ncbi:unnamed protein product, partial [Mesorhabditis spiculigera]
MADIWDAPTAVLYRDAELTPQYNVPGDATVGSCTYFGPEMPINETQIPPTRDPRAPLVADDIRSIRAAVGLLTERPEIMEDAFDEVIGMENINIIVFGGEALTVKVIPRKGAPESEAVTAALVARSLRLLRDIDPVFDVDLYQTVGDAPDGAGLRASLGVEYPSDPCTSDGKIDQAALIERRRSPDATGGMYPLSLGRHMTLYSPAGDAKVVGLADIWDSRVTVLYRRTESSPQFNVPGDAITAVSPRWAHSGLPAGRDGADRPACPQLPRRGPDPATHQLIDAPGGVPPRGIPAIDGTVPPAEHDQPSVPSVNEPARPDPAIPEPSQPTFPAIPIVASGNHSLARWDWRSGVEPETRGTPPWAPRQVAPRNQCADSA